MVFIHLLNVNSGEMIPHGIPIICVHLKWEHLSYLVIIIVCVINVQRDFNEW
jgi:hypothetical protein